MKSLKNMPRYKCHKIVQALKIKAIAYSPYTLEFEDDSFEPFAIDSAWVAKHSPHTMGYFVRYSDDYTSFSPASEFEAGYTLIEEVVSEDNGTKPLTKGQTLLQTAMATRNILNPLHEFKRAKPVVGECEWLTIGKVYDVAADDRCITLIDDDGSLIIEQMDDTTHIANGFWEFVEADSESE